jgi:DNA-binding NtrC family response regulator
METWWSIQIWKTRLERFGDISGSRFLTINCAAVPQDLAESELFGHESGAFTGARNGRKGLLELAEGGTLLLNEIAELSQSLQSKLLVFLDSRSFHRLGGEKTVHVDARILAATHRALETEVEADRFLNTSPTKHSSHSMLSSTRSAKDCESFTAIRIGSAP